MILIDAKKKLTYQSIVDFKADQSDDTAVDVVSEMSDVAFSTTLGSLQDFFKRDDVAETFVNDKDVISFLTEQTALQILGVDFKWYITPVRGIRYKRLDKLFNICDTNDEGMNKPSNTSTKKPREKTAKPTIKVECARIDKDNNIVEESTTFVGTKSEVVSFINMYYAKAMIRSRFADDAKFKVENDETWKSFDELVNEGVFLV